MQANEFWDNIFSNGQAASYSRVEMPDLKDPLLLKALNHFGNIENKTIIDLGCGRGATSLFFASHNAKVISVDFSEIAILNLTKYCQENGIKNIRPIHMKAQEILKLGQADFIFGSMILHHIEPFYEFARILNEVLNEEGKGFFWENNARSKMMIWFRENVVGKLWVPKRGDPDESPLTTSEVDELKKYFQVEVEFPELLFFRMISRYLLRGHIQRPFKILDNFFYRFSGLRKYSYRQIIYLRPE